MEKAAIVHEILNISLIRVRSSL